jgi:hypothetical protein
MDFGSWLHVFGIAIMLVVLIRTRRELELTPVLRLIGMACLVLTLGVGYNLLAAEVTIVHSLVFREVSYGSFFISLGYAMILGTAFQLIRRAVRKPQPTDSDLN